MTERYVVRLRDPRTFAAPGGLNFEKHFRLHQQEKTRYYEELAELSDDDRAVLARAAVLLQQIANA